MDYAVRIIQPLRYIRCRFSTAGIFAAEIPFPVQDRIMEKWVRMSPLEDGWASLVIKEGFLSDGCSGPTIDCINEGANTIACTIHDALYYLARHGHFRDIPEWRETADKILRDTRNKYGGASWRSRIWYRALRVFGHRDGGRDLEVKTAP